MQRSKPNAAGGRPRLARPRDLDAVATIDAACFRQPWPLATYHRELERAGSTLWVLDDPKPKTDDPNEIDPGIVAFILYWRTLDELEIHKLATLPEWRNQGCARTLLTHTLETEAATHATSAFLELRRSNEAAMELYAQLGFRASGSRSAYYDDGEDAILMRRML